MDRVEMRVLRMVSPVYLHDQAMGHPKQRSVRTLMHLRHIVWPIVLATLALHHRVRGQRNNRIALRHRQLRAIMQETHQQQMHQAVMRTAPAYQVQVARWEGNYQHQMPHRKAIHLRLPTKALSTRQLQHCGKSCNQTPRMAHQALLRNTHHPFQKMVRRSVQGQMQMHQTGLSVDQ
jgi:hypothetical protein